MKAHIKCARCGKKPRHQSAKSRAGFDTKDLHMLRREADRSSNGLGGGSANLFAQSESNEQWQSMLRPDHDHQPKQQQRKQQEPKPRRQPKPKKRRGSITLLVLPKGWSTAVDGSTGKTYYYHASTRETSWEHPGKREHSIQGQTQQAARQMELDFQAQQMRSRMNVQQQQQVSAHAVRGAASRDHRARQQQQRGGGHGGGGGGGGGNIFDRLTDSSQYTGAHKHRFDQYGRGKGLAGRDRVMKGSGYVSSRTHEGRSYVGSTNTGTDQVYHDSSQFLMRR
jgi:hypothetical protein